MDTIEGDEVGTFIGLEYSYRCVGDGCCCGGGGGGEHGSLLPLGGAIFTGLPHESELDEITDEVDEDDEAVDDVDDVDDFFLTFTLAA